MIEDTSRYVDMLISGHGFVRQEGKTQSDIDAKRQELDVDFSEELETFFSVTDGLTHPESDFRFPSLSELSTEEFEGWPFY
ncbi:MAG: hypothetical protein AAF483_31200, partial [Planctomycetota bacterium]